MKTLKTLQLILAIATVPATAQYELDNPTPPSCSVDLQLSDFIVRNVDDDNNNEEWDKEETGLEEEDDFRSGVISFSVPDDYSGTITITFEKGGDKVDSVGWIDQTKNEEHPLTWDIYNGQLVDPPPPEFYLEGVECSDDWDDIELKAVLQGGSSEGACGAVDTATTTVVEVDLDIDSKNDSKLLTEDFPEGEDKLEGSSKEIYPGKLILSAKNDEDGDMFEQPFDGFDLDPELENDAKADAVRLVPVLLTVKKPFDPETVVVRLDFKESIPQLESDGGNVISLAGDGGPPYKLGKDGMRFWTRDTTEPRSGKTVTSEPAGHSIRSEESFPWKKLFNGSEPSRSKVVYLEYVSRNPSEVLGLENVKFTAFGPGDQEATDNIKVTLIPTAWDKLHYGDENDVVVVSSNIQATSPRPSVKLEVLEVVHSGSDNFSATIRAKVTDGVSELDGVSPPAVADVRVNGEFDKSVAISNVSTEAPEHVWRGQPWLGESVFSVDIPSGRLSAFQVGYVTEPNVAGIAGIGTISFYLDSNPVQEVPVSGENSDYFDGIVLNMPTSFDPTGLDGLFMYGDFWGAGVNLTESSGEESSRIFRGGFTGEDNVPRTVEIYLGGSGVNLDDFGRPLQYGFQMFVDGAMVGSARASKASTDPATNYSLTGSPFEIVFAHQTRMLVGEVRDHGVKEESAWTYVPRLQVPDSVVHHFLGENKKFQFSDHAEVLSLIEDQEIREVDKIPGYKSIFIDDGGKAKLFCITSDDQVASAAPSVEVLENGCHEFLGRYVGSGEDEILQEVVFNYEDDGSDAGEGANLILPETSDERAFGKEFELCSWKDGRKYQTVNDLMPLYDLMFQRLGLVIYKCLVERGLVITVTNLWDVDTCEWRPKNWVPSAKKDGLVPELWIDNELSTAAEAAKALGDGCQFLAINNAVRDDLCEVAHHISDNIAEYELDDNNRWLWQEGIYTGWTTVLGYLGEGANMTVGILFEPFDWVLLVADVPEIIQGLSGDKPEAYATQVALSLLPFISRRMMDPPIDDFPGGLYDETRDSIKFVDQFDNEISVTRQVIDKIAEAAAITGTNSARVRCQRMRILSPYIRSGALPKDLVKHFYETENGLLWMNKKQSYNVLGEGIDSFEGAPRGKIHADDRQHHDVPIAKEFELRFLQAGVDPNWGEFGRYVRRPIHDSWHRGRGFRAGRVSGNRSGGPFNELWARLFDSNPNGVTYEQVFERVAAIRSGHTFLLSRVAKDGSAEVVQFKFDITE